MSSTREDSDRDANKQARIHRKYLAVAATLLLLIGAIVLSVPLLLTQNASASVETAQKGAAPGASNPDYCGTDWRVVASNNNGLHDNVLNAVTAISADDIWAVGYYVDDGGLPQALTEHWNGSAWLLVEGANTSTNSDVLTAVSASASNDVWAAGYSSDTAGGIRVTLVEHWDAGHGWQEGSSLSYGTGYSNILDGIVALSSTNIWLVGWYGDSSGVARTLVEHWSTSLGRFDIVDSPNVGTGDNFLQGVSASSGNNVWAVGYYINSSNAGRTLTEHWDGNNWSVVSSPNQNVTSLLRGVSMVSGTDGWAVGYRVNSSGAELDLKEHWNGSTWSIVSGPSVGGTSERFNSVVARSASNVWVVGNYYDASNVKRTLIEHFDGGWSVVPSLGVDKAEFFGVAALAGNNVWAVGNYDTGSNVGETLVGHYNTCANTPTPGGSTHTPVPLPTQCSLQFEDVPNPSTFYSYVQCLACRGVISGYTCGGAGEPCNPAHDPYFRPNTNVTRGQIAKIIALAEHVSHNVSGQTFEDVPPGSTFYTYTEQLYYYGAMNGYACGGVGEPCNPQGNRPYFRPNSNATRGQLAKIDSNMAFYTDVPVGQTFEDVVPGSTFYTYTQRLASRGVMGGYDCGGPAEPCVPPFDRVYFRPNANVTRGQTSKIVANTFDPNCQAP